MESTLTPEELQWLAEIVIPALTLPFASPPVERPNKTYAVQARWSVQKLLADRVASQRPLELAAEWLRAQVGFLIGPWVESVSLAHYDEVEHLVVVLAAGFVE